MDGDDWSGVMVVFVAAVAFFGLGGAVGSVTSGRLTEREVVEHGCAQYGPTTGEFEWKER